MNSENDIFKNTIAEIEHFDMQPTRREAKNETFEIRPERWLMSNIIGSIGTFFIRYILYALNINEHHVFRWRLENKYMQYLVFNHYIPKCMPETFGLSDFLKINNGVWEARQLISQGYFLKATLGECSGRDKTFDRTQDFEKVAPSYTEKNCFNEHWMIQKKIDIKKEIRIHSFERDVIYGITFKTNGEDPTNNYSDAEKFVEGVLEKLPMAILKGSLIAWDIALANDNQFYIIEGNFTGFHPEFNYGFQTSGYFQDQTYGPIICAWLYTYIKNKYKIGISSIAYILLIKFPFLKKLMFYISILKNEHLELVKNNSPKTSVSALIYVNEDINSPIGTLISYLQLINFTEMYYLILREEHFNEATTLFQGLNHIKVLAENTLFDKEEYEITKTLYHEKRKQVCCEQLFKTHGQESFIIF